MSSQGPSFPPKKIIGVVLFPEFEPLDVWGFVEAFAIARNMGGTYGDISDPWCPFRVVFLAEQMAAIRSYNGPAAMPDYTFAEAPSLDLLMVPGGWGTRTAVDNGALVEWVRRADEGVALMTSVCTGAAILARAGLLDGRHAATNHAAFAWVTSQGPRVLWDSVSRWVEDGKYVTSAGVSAGTDMALYLVSRLAGRAVAEQAAFLMEYDWHHDPSTPIVYPQRAAWPPMPPITPIG